MPFALSILIELRTRYITGTEIEPLAGEQLLNVFWAEPQRRPSIRRPSAPSGRPPSFPSGSSGSGIQNSHPRIHYHPRQY